MSKKIRVLVVDDSWVSQKLYRKILLDDGRFELLPIAANGRQAIEFVEEYHPDVVSMDVNMPVMDGIQATRLIMQVSPVPIVIVSSLYNPSEQEMAMEVLEAGAVSIMPKPNGPGHPAHLSTSRRYLNLLKSMSEVKVVRRRLYHKKEVPLPVAVDHIVMPRHNHQKGYKILVIGASAGGPESVKTILSALTPAFPLPVMIVQHIDPHFTEGFRLWLQSYSGIPVMLADSNQSLLPGHAYLAPGSKHLIIKHEGMATLSDAPPEKGHKPSVAHLFRSAGLVYGDNTIAVILSGMGSDGAAALKVLRDLGALTFAQNESSCLVYGMPGEAVRMGAASGILPPQDIVMEIMNIFK